MPISKIEPANPTDGLGNLTDALRSLEDLISKSNKEVFIVTFYIDGRNPLEDKTKIKELTENI